jgi:3-isopropylmalate/(R)-2-methylmalate dehydratase large subunit
MGRTLYDKIWDEHLVTSEEDGTAVLYIDRHLVHEVTSAQAYEGLRVAKRKVWRVSSVIATADHNTPTTGWELGYDGLTDPVSKEQITTLDKNMAAKLGVKDRKGALVTEVMSACLAARKKKCLISSGF